MALETAYHVVCDGCQNYAGYNPYRSMREAVYNAGRLGWQVKETESKTYPGTVDVAALCSYCLAADPRTL